MGLTVPNDLVNVQIYQNYCHNCQAEQRIRCLEEKDKKTDASSLSEVQPKPYTFMNEKEGMMIKGIKY